tara:strand:- start:1062 stop:1334 length:273 start_codon:yes stop_codon:yes gene_type:complete
VLYVFGACELNEIKIKSEKKRKKRKKAKKAEKAKKAKSEKSEKSEKKAKKAKSEKSEKKVSAAGLEPATPRLEVECAVQLRHADKYTRSS